MNLVTETGEQVEQGIAFAGKQLAIDFGADDGPLLLENWDNGRQDRAVVTFGIDFDIAKLRQPIGEGPFTGAGRLGHDHEELDPARWDRNRESRDHGSDRGHRDPALAAYAESPDLGQVHGDRDVLQPHRRGSRLPVEHHLGRAPSDTQANLRTASAPELGRPRLRDGQDLGEWRMRPLQPLALVKQGEAAGKAAARKVEESRIPNTKPSVALANYAGTYSGALYGDATVTEENGKLVVRLMSSPNFVGDLEHWHFDTFNIKWRSSIVYPFGRGFVTFTLDGNGKVNEMKIDVPNPDFDFTELEFKKK